jgi:NitT/TauT family transport system permease protein
MAADDKHVLAAAQRRPWDRWLADGIIVLLVVWWWLAARSLPAFVLPGPGEVLAALLKFFYVPDQVQHLASTFVRVMGSVAIATLLGLVLALVPYYVPALRGVVEERLQPVLNAIPSIGWAILAVVWFNASNSTVMIVQTAILLPFCLINASAGLREIDREVLEMGHSFTRSRWRLLVKLVLPLLVPFIVSSIQMTYGMAWKISLVSELFGSETGLGFAMLNAQESGNAAGVIATCLIVVIAYAGSERFILAPLFRRWEQNGRWDQRRREGRSRQRATG